MSDARAARMLRQWTYRRAQRSWAKQRRKAIETEPYEALEQHVDLIRRMEDSSEYQGSILAREAREISAEVINRYSWRENPDSAFFLIRELPKVPITGWPRLNRVTLQAFGNHTLLALRDEEDRIRDRWVRRAAEALTELEEGGVEPIEILDAEAGARWVREQCMGDPELAADSLLIVHPGVDVVCGVYDGLPFTNPIWKPPPLKATLRPV